MSDRAKLPSFGPSEASDGVKLPSFRLSETSDGVKLPSFRLSETSDGQKIPIAGASEVSRDVPVYFSFGLPLKSSFGMAGSLPSRMAM